MKKRKTPERQAEIEARAARRAARGERSAAWGNSPRNVGPAKVTTDVAAVKAAMLKRDRRALKRFDETGRRLGQR